MSQFSRLRWRGHGLNDCHNGSLSWWEGERSLIDQKEGFELNELF